MRDTPRIKTTNYVNVLRQQKRLAAAGAKELLYHWNGNALEASRSNLFAFYGDRLVTPFEGILLGNTRRTVLELAQGRFTIEERVLPMSELMQADEVFITGSGRKITPVIRIDDRTFSGGVAGSLTQEIIAQFENFTMHR